MANIGTRVGQLFAACAPMLLVLLGCVESRPLGTFEWEEYETRSATSPMPIAPPPAQGDHVVDVSLREIGATRTSGGELRGHPETGMHPLRTDGAISVRVSRFFSVRAIGGLGYGAPLGAASSVAFPALPTLSGGLAGVVGWWGDPDWSISLEVEATLVVLENRDRYAVVRGPCFEIIGSFSLFGSGDDVTCVRETATGEHRTYEGSFVHPAMGATLDVAGFPLRWLRIGAGASIQTYLSRDAPGHIHYEPLGIARVFVEAHYEDVWLGVEAQQWALENTTFAPALAVTIGGVAFERAAPRTAAEAPEPGEPAPEAVPASMAWTASAGEAPPTSVGAEPPVGDDAPANAGEPRDAAGVVHDGPPEGFPP